MKCISSGQSNSVCSITVSHSYLPSVTLLVSFRIFPESVSAKGSSNSEGLSNIFTSSHLLIFTSHLLIFTPSHLHIFTSSHHHIFTCSHLHILSCPLALLPSSFYFFSISLLRRGAVPTRRHETQNPFARNKVGSPKTEVKLRCYNLGGNPFARNEVRSPKTEVKLRCYNLGSNPFARNELRSPKTEVKLRLQPRRQPFRTKRASIAKNCSEIAILLGGNPFAQNELRSSKTAVKWYFLYDGMALAADCSDSYVLMSKRVVKLRFRKFARSPFARNDGRVSKTEVKLRFWRSARNPFARVCVKAILCEKGSVCKRL